MVRYFYIAALAATLLSLWSKRVTQFPCFLTYLSICLGAAVSYAWGFSPAASASWWWWHWLLWQPFLAVSLLLSVTELAWWTMLKVRISDREPLLFLMFSLAVGLTIYSWASMPARDSVILLAADLRHYLDMGIAVWLLVGVACLWQYGPPWYLGEVKTHGLLLTTYCVIWAAMELLTPAWPTEAQWLRIDTVAHVLNCLCLLAWSIGLHGEAPAARVASHP